ncbi:MAG: hypothetical protein LBM96_00725 [Methanobrevibacter sp.]|jgi:hypothetical protein|nr:hypothetical protein [Candidatus Methanoflexus mossambicus]
MSKLNQILTSLATYLEKNKLEGFNKIIDKQNCEDFLEERNIIVCSNKSSILKENGAYNTDITLRIITSNYSKDYDKNMDILKDVQEELLITLHNITQEDKIPDLISLNDLKSYRDVREHSSILKFEFTLEYYLIPQKKQDTDEKIGRIRIVNNNVFEQVYTKY